ncbi:MAG: deoxyribonuclease IV [Planctomycetota bacterium]|jgi:deoxyribonuclease-4
MRIGAHMSIAGGLHNALLAGREYGFDTIQIFVKNQRQWSAKRLRRDEVEVFHETQEATGIAPVVAHNTYLINLASPDSALREKSIRALTAEVKRADRLHIPLLVIHPGAHGGAGEEAGIRRIARALDRVYRGAEDASVRIALETTAGQGTGIGHRFEQLRRILDLVEDPDRLRVCFDTCHAFAAGYDFRDATAYVETFTAFDRIVGLDRLAVFHFNDALHPLGRRKDRHAHIGEGHLGDEAFRLILRDPRFREVPKIFETPKLRDGVDMDRVNFERLKRLAGG